jgi:AcrR family transcriptional regulator
LRAGLQTEPHPSHPRERYLAIAARLAGAQASRHFAVSHVTVGAVAAAAGVSRGALYRLWGSQQDFWNDLIAFLDGCPHRAMAEAAETGSPRPSPRTESFSDAAQHVLLSGTLTLLRTATADMAGPDAVDAGLDARRAERLAQLADGLDRATRAAGRQFCAGLTPADLAAAVTALGTGLPVVARMCAPEDLRFDSPWFDRPPNGPRSMLGVATEAIRDWMTETADVQDQTERTSPEAPARRHATSASAPVPAGRRRAYLEIGARLATTRHGTAAHRVLGHVTLESVARAAGVTRRTVASVWPDQDAFRLDLFTHLLREDRAAVVAAVRDAAIRHDPARPAGDAFAEVGAHVHRSLTAGAARPTFRSYATQLDEPSVAARAIDEHRRLADSCTIHLHRLLALTNRQLRAGVVGRQVAALLFALNDGFGTLLRTFPSAVRAGILLDHVDGRERAHSTVGVTIGAVLAALTEPLDGSPEINRYVALIS